MFRDYVMEFVRRSMLPPYHRQSYLRHQIQPLKRYTLPALFQHPMLPMYY